MANNVKQQLLNISGNTSGSHKDQSDRYRLILETITNSPNSELAENLKLLVDQSKLKKYCFYKERYQK